MSKSIKEYDVLAKRFGYVTQEMLDGLLILPSPDPFAFARQVDGMARSDVDIALNVNGIDNIVADVFAQRPHADAQSPVGQRHVSLSTAFNSARMAENEFKSAALDEQSKLDAHFQDTHNEPAPSNDGNLKND
mgnify:CR=1 FL=1